MKYTNEQIINYLKENEEVANEAIEELNSWNGYAQDDIYYPMETLNEFYYNQEPSYILERAFYGYDEDTHDAFNPNREYFKCNGYGNLVSTDYKDYSYLIDEYLIEELKNNYNNLYINDDELKEMLENC